MRSARRQCRYGGQLTVSSADAVVESAVRHGPMVRLVVRLHDGDRLAAAVTAIDHPTAGDRVTVAIDPDGVVEVG